VAAPDPLVSIRRAADKVRVATEARDAAIRQARRDGASWHELAAAADLSRSGVKQISRRHTGTIVSIGYEGRDLDSFLSALRINRVDVVVDVRLTPISRKRGFSKTALSTALDAANVGYLHVPELGNPKDNRDAFGDGRVELGRARFTERLDNGSGPSFDQVLELAREQRIALLCFERDEEHCHRWCITHRAQAEHPALNIVRV